MTASASSRPEVKGLNCPNCGNAVTIRGFEHTLTVVCDSCHSILDAKDPNLAVLQRFSAQEKKGPPPRIPLGTRGTLHGQPYEVIGYQVRAIDVDGVQYHWAEYLLFNPYRGFRYVTEYDGHWNDVATVRTLPVEAHAGRPTATFRGRTFKHFQTATAKTIFVLGEFPWQVRVGDTADASDYVSPPYILSRESTEEETAWSYGEYVDGDDIWKAFKLSGSPPTPVGVYANQPSPYGAGAGAILRTFLRLAAALVLLFIVLAVMSQNREVFRTSWVTSAGGKDTAFVTPVFPLGGHASNLRFYLETQLSNSWEYFTISLINDSTGQTLEFGREVSYYSGVDGGESWSEGSRTDVATLPTVPPGQYFLRIQPEGPSDATPQQIQLRVKRDVPRFAYFVIALILLGIPLVFIAIRAVSFENARWKESDYGPFIKSSDDDE